MKRMPTLKGSLVFAASLFAIGLLVSSGGAESPPKENEAETTSKYPKPPEEELRKKLTEVQYRVTQEDATEPPFENAYWDNKKEGIYVDVVSGEPLFSSKDKFRSGTGWPSFTRPLVEGNVVTKTDYKLIYPRTEVRSKHGDSHLGHLFEDGPKPTGLRYCLNSAALRFVPADRLGEEGYGQFTSLFESTGVDPEPAEAAGK